MRVQLFRICCRSRHAVCIFARVSNVDSASVGPTHGLPAALKVLHTSHLLGSIVHAAADAAFAHGW